MDRAKVLQPSFQFHTFSRCQDGLCKEGRVKNVAKKINNDCSTVLLFGLMSMLATVGSLFLTEALTKFPGNENFEVTSLRRVNGRT